MLNNLNVELQGKDKTVVNMISSVNAFKQKMQHLCSKLQRHDLANFQNLVSELETQGKTCAQLDSGRQTEQIENCQDFNKTVSRLCFIGASRYIHVLPFSGRC